MRSQVESQRYSRRSRTSSIGLITIAILSLLLVGEDRTLAHTTNDSFPKQVYEEEQELLLNGVGLCEWGIFGVNLYHAALYLEALSSNSSDILKSTAAKRIDLVFCRKLTQEQMRKAYRSSFEKNATAAEKSTFSKEISQFVDQLVVAKKGDRLGMIHQPGKGLILRQKSGELGPIGGDEFAQLVFRLYLGEHPPTKKLRKKLLGRHPAAQIPEKSTPEKSAPEKPTPEKPQPPKPDGDRSR